MFLRKFLNGRIAPLTIEGEGAPAGGGGGGGDGAGAAETFTFAPDKPFAEQLPEKYRGNTAFVDIKNFDGLLSQFDSQKRMLGADKATLLAMPKDDDAKAWGDMW